jgi:hypothetical protein
MPELAAGGAGPVLVLAPTGRDAEVAVELLGRQSIACRAVPNLTALRAAIDDEAGAVLVADEALSRAGLDPLSRKLA